MIYPWLPEKAGGVNFYEDISSLPSHQLTQCDNYYPYGRRWRMLNGNTSFVGTGAAPRIRHLAEYQQDDGALGTTKRMYSFETNGNIYEIDTGTRVSRATGFPASVTTLYDSTTFQGVFLLADGTDALQETSNGTTFGATAGTPPSAPQYVRAWKNRVFLAGRTATPLTVAYCADGDRTTWTGSDAGTEVITSAVGDFITGMEAVENYLALFTRRTVTLLLGDHPDNWTKRTLYEDGGTSSHRTLGKAFGGLVYANDFGVFFLDARGIRTELSRDIRPYWQGDSSLTNYRNVARGKFLHAVYDPTADRQRYYIWLAEGTSTKEAVCAIYHFISGEWTFMRSFLDSGQTSQASCLREDGSGNIQVYFAGGSDDTTTADKKVFAIDNTNSVWSFASVTGGNIVAVLTSGMLGTEWHPYLKSMGIASTKVWKDFYAKFTDGPSTGTLTFTFTTAMKAAYTAQQTATFTYGGTGNVTRDRLPISKSGWGLQIKVNRTAQGAHDFIGGLIDFDETGTV